VATRYNVDRNRIYLCGVSMGGCGTLGIGLPNGDIFAAIKADVPAGTNYANYRLAGSRLLRRPMPRRRNATPGCCALRRWAGPTRRCCSIFHRRPIIGRSPSRLSYRPPGRASTIGVELGGYGHTTFGSLIAKFPVCQVPLAFPWFEIRKNQAYPVSPALRATGAALVEHARRVR